MTCSKNNQTGGPSVAKFDAAVGRFKARLLKGTEADLVRIKIV